MVLKIIKRLAIYGAAIFSTMLVFSLFLVANVEAVSLVSLSPASGHVGDKVSLSGDVPPNNNWNVYFDVNNDGKFTANERVANAKAGSTSSLSSAFNVPACAGGDGAGVAHAVQLSTEYVPTPSPIPTVTPTPPPDPGPNFIFNFFASAATPYDAPYSDTKNFSVITVRSFDIPSTIHAGDPIPINLSISGGKAAAAYNYRVEVTKPDKTTSTVNFNATTDSLGTASATLNYPNTFPSGQSTNQSGNYSVLIRETSPLDSFQYSATVNVTNGGTTTVSPPPSSDNPPNSSSSTSNNNQGSTSTSTQGTSPSGTGTSPSSGTETTSPTPTPGGSSSTGTSGSTTGSTTPSPAPGNPHSGGGNNGNPTNQPPAAYLTSTPPTQITQGQSVIILCDANDSDGTIVAYSWTSDISGLVGTSSQLDTSGLVPGTHHITFQATDNEGAASNTVMMTLTVNSPGFEPLPIVAAGVGTAVAVSAGAAAIWLHFGRLNSVKIKARLNQKNEEQKTKEEKEDKNEKRKNQKQPYIVFSNFDAPTNIMKGTDYFAKFSVKNVGTAKATGVIVHALENPFFNFKAPLTPVADLSPGQTAEVTLPFTTNAEIRKNVYQMQFQLKSKQTAMKTKRCFMRGGRIAVLTDANDSDGAEPVMSWLRENNYPCEELHDASHLLTKLYQYDLLIVSAKQDMPAKWVQNLCTFVENGQSILLLDRISTVNSPRLDEALGYVENPNPVTFDQAALEICKQHPVTNGLNLGAPIPLGPCVGHEAKFTGEGATVLANSIDQSNAVKPGPYVAAVMVKEDGKGKFVHINFQAQDHLNQIDQLTKNAINWLLWD